MVNSKFRVVVEKVRAKLHGLKKVWKKLKQRRLAKKAEPVASNEFVTSTSKKVNTSKLKKRTVVVLGFGVLAAIFVAVVTFKNISSEKMPTISSKIVAFFETAKQTVLKQPKPKQVAPKRLTLPGNPTSTNQELLGRLLIVIALALDPYGGIVGVSLGIIGRIIQRFFK
jgi:hypothetical protein